MTSVPLSPSPHPGCLRTACAQVSLSPKSLVSHNRRMCRVTQFIGLFRHSMYYRRSTIPNSLLYIWGVLQKLTYHMVVILNVALLSDTSLTWLEEGHLAPPPGTRSVNVLFGHFINALGDSLQNLLCLLISWGGFSTPTQIAESRSGTESIAQISPWYFSERISLVREKRWCVVLVPVFFLFLHYIDCSAHITSCGTRHIRWATKVALPYGKRLNKE